ncbi:Prefoldin beta-like protein [Auriculariales sp. MPI-PUGE-AT-0066]|nr:Prefoldin beta-like protein [Auriculariales sp. MPI-PUGE-AT-0066]
MSKAVSSTPPKPVTSSAKGKTRLSEQEVQQAYQRLQSELQQLTSKINELEQDAEEHDLVLGTLNDALTKDPNRKCFRLIGGVLVERTVQDVVPSLTTNRDGIKNVITNLVDQYKSKEQEFTTLVTDYKIRVVRS